MAVGETSFKDVIVAQASAAGSGAVGVVRISGEGCHELIWPFLELSILLCDLKDHYRKTLRFGFKDPATLEVVDDGLCVFFQGPASYTGEDSVELFLHGSPYVLSRVLEILHLGGLRAAVPGEFTQRAYLNGKIDLTMAEGIRDLAFSRSWGEWKAARSLASGALSEHIESLRRSLVSVRAHLEVYIDHPEEQDTSSVHLQDLHGQVLQIRESLVVLKKTLRSGEVAREGLQVLLCGAPNAGKSTLINALLGSERVIVTSEAGTTRDFITLPYLLGGRLIHLYDSAGLRERSSSLPEAELVAIEKTLHLIKKVHLMVLVIPSTKKRPDHLSDFYKSYQQTPPQSWPPMVRVISHGDLGVSPVWQQEDDLTTSLVEGEVQGVERLKELLTEHMDRALEPVNHGVFITTARHKAALESTIAAVDEWCEAFEKGAYVEILALELRRASEALGAIIGEVDDEEILGEIFSSFCLGK